MSIQASTTTDSDFDPEVSKSPTSFIHTSESLRYVVTHVFLPVELPEQNDYTLGKSLSLTRSVCTATHAYITLACQTSKPQWHRIARMLDNLLAWVQSEPQGRDHIVPQLRSMHAGDICAFFIRSQNAGIILTRTVNYTLYESFYVLPSTDDGEGTAGHLVCSYPRSVLKIPNPVFDDLDFQSDLAGVLSCPTAVDLKRLPHSSPHSEFIAAMLNAVQGTSGTVDVPRITKHVRDHDNDLRLFDDIGDEFVWHRSFLWLFVRISIQMSLERSPLGHTLYKRFILFFLCALARDRQNASLPSDLLHLMSSKILRRLSKLGSPIPDWLSNMAMKTCTDLQQILDARWKPLSSCLFPFRNPSQDELVRDTQLSLLHSRGYISNALTSWSGHGPDRFPLYPSPRIRRGSIDDFFSSNGSYFEEACGVDPQVTLYDFEKLVEQGLDDWLACVTNVDEACSYLEIMMDKYVTKARSHRWDGNPEDASIMFLTAIELFIAMDKLAVREIPILVDYSPEISTSFLEKLFLRKATSLHRLSRAYQYLHMRQSHSCLGWSLLSNQFTGDSFPVRYYDQSQHMQHLRARIDQDAMAQQADECADLHQESASGDPAKAHQECRQRPCVRSLADGARIGQSPFPVFPLYAKVVAFETQCPPSIRAWRSAAARILHCSFDFLTRPLTTLSPEQEDHLLERVPTFRPYLVERCGPPLSFQIHFVYFYTKNSQSHSNPTLRYAIQHPKSHSESDTHTTFSTWWPEAYYNPGHQRSFHVGYEFRDAFGRAMFKDIARYISFTTHTPNDVLAAQAQCPEDLSIDEFIAFGNLRSGGSLQWGNILRGIRSRTLNFRRHHVHYLLAQAVFEAGPFDLDIGTWVWHRELQDSCFCKALLDELNSLFVDIGASSIDATMMNTICLLLNRILASAPNELVSNGAITLLRKVRRKTLDWVQELSYNLAKAPMNKQRSDLLLVMAATCRSTFDADSATLPGNFLSAEDVDAALSCALLIHALRPESIHDNYLRLLLDRDCRLALTLEIILSDMILADPSDYGIDLAVRKVFACHKPSLQEWEKLPHPNSRWLTCITKAVGDRPSQIVHLNLLNGTLQVDGRSLGVLPSAVRNSRVCQEIFRDQGFFVIPSNLSGMEFTTLAMTSRYKVHFALRGDSLMVRAQCNQSKHILELIPSKKLKRDLPPVLIDGHVHWLDLSTRVIEIRPLERLWEQSPEDWMINCTSPCGQYQAHRGRELLVDIQSPTWATVSKFFECLNIMNEDSKSDLLLTTSPVEFLESTLTPQLSAVLPRYRLSFFANARGELESRDFKDMVYDENQRVGTLFGLENILVLRQKSHLTLEELIARCVLIPTGHVVKYGNHQVRVDVKRHKFAPGEPLYHTYNVDTELGSLVGNGTQASTAYLARLHTMTNYHRPDPLTGQTGVQAALSLLRSAGCRSIMKIKALTFGTHGGSTHYPQVASAEMEILHRCYWNRHLHLRDARNTPDKRDALRARYLFPWHDNGPAIPGDNYTCENIGLAPCTATEAAFPHADPPLQHICHERAPWQITLDQLFSNRSPPGLPLRNALLRDSHTTKTPDHISDLSRIFSSLMKNKSKSLLRQEYIALLEQSAQHVSEDSRTIYELTEGKRIRILEKHYAQCRVSYLDGLTELKKCLGPGADPYQQALSQIGQLPPITADILLRCLASTSSIKLTSPWRKCLISFALLLLDLQRARRLLRFALDGLEQEFSKELENEGCAGWDPEEYPDWLLIQVEGNFLIRRAQAEAALEMISPQSGENTVMQVNMGEGKSSVIVPIAAAALADGKRLVRVIVPKAQVVQMFELLVSRLGGLVNRPIYYLPFTRSPEYRGMHITSVQVDDLHKLMPRCMAERGILLAQPEHIASLKLMAVEKQISKGRLATSPQTKVPRSLYQHIMTLLGSHSLPEDSFVGEMFRWLSQSSDPSRKKDVALTNDHADQQNKNAHGASGNAFKWLSLQNWIDLHVRDILDESDEILHPRFQLIYTIGHQQHTDGYPDRWTITQQVLRLVRESIPTLSKNHPNSVEYRCGPRGSFPHVRCVRLSDVGQGLISLVVEHIMAGRLPNFNFRHTSPALQRAIRSFISDENVLQVPGTVKRVEEYAKDSNQTYLWNGLLLLRGLFACNVLSFTLTKRRWRVDYGLVPQSQHSDQSSNSTLLAVPYRAKDMPAPNTQFGHPDVTIVFTCLSYYYGGLDQKQLRLTFEILLEEDDPLTEYGLWIKEYESGLLPKSLRTPCEINLKSSEQWNKVIFPLFTWNQATIDFYLSRVVFPSESKEYPWKLAVSSWDLAERRENITTGFSGTNDSRWLLPMSIAQRDLHHQLGTNAMILAYLLQPENNFYTTIHENEERQIPEFLRIVAMQQPKIHVLLDVGAQILNHSNQQVAKAWLDIAHDATAAIYFHEDGELMILNRDGVIQLMLSSPLSHQLDHCVIYLDHAHTRGTDIKLPIGSRAAVTLGPMVTKDRLVQGCMRMRKLGHGHSVMFFAPPEVDLCIRTLAGKEDPNAEITTADILCWAIHETWNDIHEWAPYWAGQSVAYKSRQDAWTRFYNNDLSPEQLSAAWLYSESKTLVDLYAPSRGGSASNSLSVLDPEILEQCKVLGVLSLPDARMTEECEREVSQEREREREVELPPRAESAGHSLHQDVVTFVKTGIVPPLRSGSAFRPVFTTLTESSAATCEADVWSSLILATADFCSTVRPESTWGSMDQYLRPVQWILSRNKEHDPLLVLLSPFEANHLMSYIRSSEHVRLHMYAPRTSQRMKPSDDLTLYSIPSSLPPDRPPPWTLIDQLNVFAGQLYLRDYNSYLRLRHFLGVHTTETLDSEAVRWNLFNIPGSFEENEFRFTESPLPSVMALLAIRSRGRPFTQTHMGKILQGRRLTTKDFEVATARPQSSTDITRCHV